MSEANPFGPAQRAAIRAEVLRDGLLADKFLSGEPDVPTFGLNLACAWPFPEAWRAGYERLAQRLGALGDWLYVYPLANTHVTLVTLVSFARHIRPIPETVHSLEARVPEIIAALSPLLAGDSRDGLKSFQLQPEPPVLARGAGILPLVNPDGEVQRLRASVRDLLQRNAPLHRELVERGLNVPGIVHSSILRFRQPPPKLEQFLAAFDEIAAEVKFPPMDAGEILLTTETKPYMRGGEIRRRFAVP